MTDNLKKSLEAEGYLQLREVPNRGICGINKYLFTIGLVWGIDETGYKGRWCYDNVIAPAVALELWDGVGDPSGNWIKYKGLGGDRSREETV